MNSDFEQLSAELSLFFSDHFITKGTVSSVLIILGILVLRYFSIKMIKRKKVILNKDQRRWVNRINNIATTLVVLGIVLIWAPQLQTFALSLTAVAVAIVLSTKELLMCLTGGFLNVSSKAFDVGDWITVDDITGEVMSIAAMTTVVEKIDVSGKSYQFTGDIIQIPNSLFLTSNIENAAFLKDYIYHDFSIVIQYADLDVAVIMKKLKEITHSYYKPFEADAIKFNKRVERKVGVDFADPHPQFFLKTTDIGHIVFTVKFFIPTQKAQETGSKITEDFLSFSYKLKSKGNKGNIND